MVLGGWIFHPPQSAERRKVPARHTAHRTRHTQPCTLAHSAHASTARCRPRCRSCSTQACWPLKTRACDEIATNEAAELCKRALRANAGDQGWSLGWDGGSGGLAYAPAMR